MQIAGPVHFNEITSFEVFSAKILNLNIAWPEELISNSDSKTSIDVGNYYLILPNIDLKKNYRKSKLLKNDFMYRSDLNKHQLSIKNLSKLIKDYSDEN